MGIETILALMLTISMLSTILMAAFVWKLNSDWMKVIREMDCRIEAEHTVMMALMCGGGDDEEESE